jgi:hypothetical protein
MGEVSIIGLDLAKNVFQAHGAGADGSVIFRRKLSRATAEVQGSACGCDQACLQQVDLGAAIHQAIEAFSRLICPSFWPMDHGLQ